MRILFTPAPIALLIGVLALSLGSCGTNNLAATSEEQGPLPPPSNEAETPESVETQPSEEHLLQTSTEITPSGTNEEEKPAAPETEQTPGGTLSSMGDFEFEDPTQNLIEKKDLVSPSSFDSSNTTESIAPPLASQP